MTKIALHSDLHLDIQKLPDGWLKTIPDILVLAGDILRIDKSISFLNDLAEQYADMHIIYVTGNHEYYYVDDMVLAEKEIKNCFQGHPRIHFLQKNIVEIQGIKFLGATGWSTMLGLGADKQQESKLIVEQSINDFRLIGYDGNIFKGDDCIELGDEHYRWLESILKQDNHSSKTVVITHFAPSILVRNPKYPIDAITAYFLSCYDELIFKYSPEIWMYGHTHANFDTKIGKTRVISNQKGYGRECYESYKPDWIIEI